MTWSERRRLRRKLQRLPEDYPRQKYWEMQFLLVAVVLSVAVGAASDYMNKRRAERTQMFLLLAFEGVGVETDQVQRAWSKFATG